MLARRLGHRPSIKPIPGEHLVLTRLYVNLDLALTLTLLVYSILYQHESYQNEAGGIWISLFARQRGIIW